MLNRKIVRTLRTKISVNPSLYIPIARFTKGDWVVAKDTDIVIEGYPRSGNSFAEAAFRHAQDNELKIAHHCHAAAQILGAAKWNIPCLVIIRDPIESARSLVMHQPELFDAKNTLEEYVIFHKAIQSCRDSFILADFKTVTNDFGSVIKKINEKFGTRFDEFDSAEDDAKAFEMLDKLSKERGTAGEGGEPYSIQRSEEEKLQREKLKEEARIAVGAERLSGIRKEAQQIFEELIKTKDI